MVHEAGIEQVDAGRHRRVRGEDVAGARGFQRLVEGQPGVAHEPARIRSSARNAEWPSFMWNTVGVRPIAFERPHAADAQHDLLPDARIDVAAVERVGDVAVLRQHILRDVGVEQVELDPARRPASRPE